MLRNRSVCALTALVMSAGACVAQQSDDAGYRAATGLLHRNMPEQAAAEYTAFLKDHPDHPKAASARYALAVCYSRLGRWPEAGQELDRIGDVKEFEFAADAQLLRARAFMADGKYEPATRRLRMLLDEFPKFEQADAAAALLGEALYRIGKPAEAKQELERVGTDWPRSASRARAELFLALIESGEGKDREASQRLSSFSKVFAGSELIPQAMLVEAQCRHRLATNLDGAAAAEQREHAARLYEGAAKTEALAPDALLGLAQLKRSSGQAAQAAATLDDVLKRFPRSTTLPAVMLERARVFLDQEAPDRALALLESLAKDETASVRADAAYWAAKAELRLSKFDAAAARLDRFVSDNPESSLLPEAMFDCAVALSRAGKAEEAARAYRVMRTKFPVHPLVPEALCAEASIALASGEEEHAIELCNGFLKKYNSHAKTGAVRLLLADAQSAAGHPDLAAEQYAEYMKARPDDPQFKNAAIRRGLALARAGKADDATEALATSMKMPGKSDAALQNAATMVLADSAIARGDWAAAEQWLAPLAGEKPDALLKLGIALERQGRGDEALKQFERLLSSFASDPAALQAAFERAQILVEKGKLDEARPEFERIIREEEKSGASRFVIHCRRHLAAIATRQGRPDDAAKILDQVASSPEAGALAADAAYDRAAAMLAAGQYEQAEQAFGRFVQKYADHPRAADSTAQQAIALSRLGKHEEALVQFDSIVPKASEMRPEVADAMRYERAWVLNQLGRGEQAREAYQQLLAGKQSPSLESHGALELAQFEAAAGRYKEALELLTRALRAAETIGEQSASVTQRVLYVRAACELKLDRPADAVATLDDLLKRFPKSELASAAELLAGQAGLKAGKPESAAAHLQRALDSNPPAETVAPALLCLGEALAASQQWGKSQAMFERFLKQFPESEFWFQAQFGIAWAIENQGRHAEAISAYRDVVSRHSGPTAARAQFQIGECLFALKQHEEAVRELLKVDILYAYPEWSAAALYEAGRCLVQLNKSAEARVQFQLVIDRFKDTQWANLAAQQLKTTSASRDTLPGRAAAPDAR